MVCAGLLLACAGAGGSAAQTSKSADAIAGTWTRPVPGEASAREGIVLAEGGVLGLIGAPALHGLAWRLEADHLVLTTGTARRPHPRDQRLRFSLPKPGTLVLTAAGGDAYLVGEYRRDDAAAGRLSGTVTHRRTDPLPPTAVLHVALSDVSRVDTSAVDIAWRAIPVEGRRVPMAFDLFYDRSAIDPSRSYALRASITDGGQRIFITKIPYPVITHGAPDRAAMVVTPFSEPHSPELTRGEHARLRGIVSLVPGPSRFLDCASGREVPVVETDGYPAVEDTWIHARLGPDDPVLMSVEGHYDLRDAQDGAGREMALLVTRALRGWPTRT